MNGTERRRYDSLRRDAQARQTRADISEAARRLFVSQGWAATTIRSVAQEAGVSVPTIYSAYGDKAGLTLALAEAADLSADSQQMLEELEDDASDPRRQLAAMAGYDRRLFERAGDLIALVREAGRTEAELDAAYRAGRSKGDETRTQVFSSWPRDTLREDLTVPRAVDVYAAICNVDVYNTFILERGWSPDDVEEWWVEALPRELLQNPG